MSEPGGGFFQDLLLLLQPFDLSSLLGYLGLLIRGQPILALARIELSLFDPLADGLSGRFELASQLIGSTTSS